MSGKRRRDTWTIEIQDYETDEAFRAAVAEELARFEHIGHRQGFGIVAAPVRQKVGEGIVTLGWTFRSERIPLLPVGEEFEDLPDPTPEPEEDEEPGMEEPEQTPPEPQPAAVATHDPYAEND